MSSLVAAVLLTYIERLALKSSAPNIAFRAQNLKYNKDGARHREEPHIAHFARSNPS
jgi:hypothetical protein